MGNFIRNSVFEYHTVAPVGGYAAGAIINYNDHSWVLQGLQDIPEGKPAVFRRDCVVELTKANAATSFAAGVAVGYNEDAQTIVAAGAGDFDLFGQVRKTAGAGVATVLFALNENAAA